jgi:hypothetical protein
MPYHISYSATCMQPQRSLLTLRDGRMYTKLSHDRDLRVHRYLMYDFTL